MSWLLFPRTLRSMWCSKRRQVPGQVQREPHWAVRSPRVQRAQINFVNCYNCSGNYNKRQPSTRRNSSNWWSRPLLANFPESRFLDRESLRCSRITSALPTILPKSKEPVTPIGARSPHSGGYFLKLLSNLNQLSVHYGP